MLPAQAKILGNLVRSRVASYRHILFLLPVAEANNGIHLFGAKKPTHSSARSLICLSVVTVQLGWV